jgi:alkyldihydroxyacetonephosphate synthase
VFKAFSTQIKQTITTFGGSLSHHHGIGKKNNVMYSKVTSSVGKKIMRSLKEKIDPKNVFAAGNLIYQHKLSANL